MATVYLAHDVRHERRVAIKVLRPEVASSIGATVLLREIRIAASLQHPHIVPLFDSGESEGLVFYVMPHVVGESLRARLTREPIVPVEIATRIARDVADALAYAHARGIIHRDIKPDNILLSGDAEAGELHAFVADFGVAKAVDSARFHPTGGADRTLTGIENLVGTPRYMSPEHAAGKHVDTGTDIYALGIVAYEMLAGIHPFAAELTAQQSVLAHLGATPEPVGVRGADIPESLATVVMRCLEKDPARRLANGGDLLVELDRIRRHDEPVRRAARWRYGRRAAALSTVAVMVLATAGGAAWYRRSVASDPASLRVLVVPFDNATGDSTLAPFGYMAADWVAQGLAQAGTVQVTADLTQRASGEAGLKAAAAENGAGTVVSGAYYLDSDSVRLQARITDARRWTLRRVVSSVSASRATPTAMLEPLRQRVMAVVLVAHDPRAVGWEIGAPPPTYAAYEQHIAGLTVFGLGDWRGAIPYWNRAAALDSAYAQPILHVSQAYLNMGEDAAADSVARQLERRDTLAPFDRGMLDYLRGLIDGNNTGALDGARAMVSAASGAPVSHLLEAFTAARANHPREALRAAARVPYQFGRWRTGWSAQIYWRMVTDAHHML